MLNLRFLTDKNFIPKPPVKHKIVNSSSTCPGESLKYMWSFSSLSWKLCEWMLNLRFLSGWIYVFWVINFLFLNYPVKHKIANPSTTRHGESLTYLWSFSSVSWKLCECMLNSRFWVINPIFPNPQANHKIDNRFTTCAGESLTYLWSFSSVSWKL